MTPADLLAQVDPLTAVLVCLMWARWEWDRVQHAASHRAHAKEHRQVAHVLDLHEERIGKLEEVVIEVKGGNRHG